MGERGCVSSCSWLIIQAWFFLQREGGGGTRYFSLDHLNLTPPLISLYCPFLLSSLLLKINNFFMVLFPSFSSLSLVLYPLWGLPPCTGFICLHKATSVHSFSTYGVYVFPSYCVILCNLWVDTTGINGS